MEKKRKPIPEHIKRQIRQEACFGCCKCGIPIFEYHHIVRYSDKAEDIMILCRNCHGEPTAGAMTIQEQRMYKKEPFNKQKGYANGMLKINNNVPAILIGTNLFVGISN